MRLGALLVIALLTAACRRDDAMVDQPRYKPLAQSHLFSDGAAARPLVPGVVSRDAPDAFPPLPPSLLTLGDLQRGRQRYTIYCSVCHGLTGDGDGMIVQRGFPNPPSYHTLRLRTAPLQHFYDVITHGYGAMYSYQDRIAPDDRWRIAAYVRVLQFSQYADAPLLSPEELQQLPKEAP